MGADDRNSAAVPPIESGEFPFPLTGGSKESPYLTWLRNHSNYMATRGLADFLRATSVLVRGIVVNFLVFLPYLLAVAVALALAHNWLLAHPYRLTLGALGLAAAWILIFPALIPLFEIVTYKRSVETGSASTVKQRDRYERSFGTLLLVVLSVAALESLPRALVDLHDLIHLECFGWKGLATVSVGLAFFSSASKLLSVLGGLKKKLAMVLIGVLGLMAPLIVILYALDFLVYSLPPSPLVMYSPLVVPVIGVIGILVAIPLGLQQRAFTRKEIFAVVGLLVVGSTLLIAVIVVSRLAIGTAKERDDLLDKDLKPITEIAAQSESIVKRQEMAPEVATLFDAFVRTDRESKSVLDSPRQKQIEEELKDFAKSAACNDLTPGLDSPANLFRRLRDCLRLDELQAEWDRPYFTKGLQLALLGHKLSQQPDETLAPLRREFTRLAQGQLLEQMRANDKGDDRVAERLRGALVEQYLSSSSSLEEAVGRTKVALSRSTAEDIAVLAGGEKTTPAKLIQDVVGEFNAPGYRRWLSKDILPAEALAAQAEPAAQERSAAAETSRRCLAFFYSTGALWPNDQGDSPAREAGEGLAKRALQNLPVDFLRVLAFALGDYDAKELEKDYDKANKDGHKAAELKSFLDDLEKLPLKDLARDHLSVSLPKRDGPKEGEFLYQWGGEYRFTLLLAAKALGNDTEALARLARENLIERALAPDTRVGEHTTILQIVGQSPKEVYGNRELARIAVAKWSGDPAKADDLIRAMMFGSLGTLERSGLAKVGESVTRDVMLPKVIFVSLFAVVIWLLWWLAVDVNLTSVHGLYRDRLASAFLIGRDTKGDIGIEEDIDLDDICRYDARSTAPYHLINVALNLQGSKDPNIRDRRSDFFIFSRRFTGGARTGYCRSVSMEQVFPQMDVSTAMAISAAAASPNMGRATSPLLVAFMTLLNIRLGYWVPNPGILEEQVNTALRERRKKDPTRPPGFTFEEIFAEELQEIESRWGQVYRQGPRRRIANREASSDPTVTHELAGIGFSGGGIRSAAFNLGITQALHHSGAFDHLDYMSTVSGGGYLGSSISTLMRAREKTKSEIAGSVTISRTEDEQMVIVTSKDGQEKRAYRFSDRAILNVGDGQNIAAQTLLLNPGRGRSDIAGQVAVDEKPPNGGYKVRVQGAPSDGHRNYRFSEWESLAVKSGDRIKKGDKLIQRYDALSDRFHWRVRPTAYLREMLSKLDEKHRWVNLSDGGHIENLACIELLRRRCRYIVIGNGEADPQLHFAGLARLMRYARIDLGIDIKIELGPIRLRKPAEGIEEVEVSGAHWAFGTITYPRRDRDEEPEEGYLLYLQSSFTGDEDEMICEYRHRNPAFPHQSTADQFFGEDQFEAYRALGQHIAEDALQAWKPANPAQKMSFDDFKAWFDHLERKQGESKTRTADSSASWGTANIAVILLLGKIMLIERQIAERQARASGAVARVLERPASGVYGDYQIKSASGKTYRVALRGPGLFDNYCSCPDFAVNTLGTCKHIEAMLAKLKQRKRRAPETAAYRRSRASISLQYGDTIGVKLNLPDSPSPALRSLAQRHFDAAGLLRTGHHRKFAEVLEAIQRADDQTVVYSDVLEHLDRENELAEGLELESKSLAELKQGRDPAAGLLKTKLLPYQARGALFAACRGRVVLADDMGLGKTIQALAAAELLRRRKGIERVLVIAPASVKYQWKTEIEKFTNHAAQVIDGLLPRRQAQYASPTFFTLTSYELALKDVRYMHELKPDLIILDEAQRIRNWTTATARTIKQLKSRYAFVLTGTPLENKLEELFSVVEFVDGRRFGPAFRFLDEHRMEDENGKLLGYRGLDRIHDQMAPILLRRTRGEVLKELPERTDQVFRVPLTPDQAEPYYEQSDILAQLMRKWERQGWLSEIDQKRVLGCIQNMRMLCNSTFLFDKTTHHSPKLEEFREILTELAIEENRKVVVFSEYERMTYLAGEELRKLKIGFVSLHGGVPSRQRGALMEKFRSDPACKVFLSTDAGGVGLNLQAASAVVNFEPPWNPARLEQRIARVHRMGQSRPVHVVHMLTSDSIEERVWETLRLKKSLFAGVFDSPTGEISFEKLGRKSVLQEVKEIFANQPARPKPLIDREPPIPLKATEAGTAGAGNLEKAAAGLIEAGVKFIESLASGTSNRSFEQVVSGWFKRDATDRPVLSIPLPESLNQERIVGAISSLVNTLGRAAAAGK